MTLANKKNCCDGLDFMRILSAAKLKFDLVFFDPQYRGVMDHLKFGNEGKGRMVDRASLTQMSEPTIKEFALRASELLVPSGYLFFWIDKFHLVEGSIHDWLPDFMSTVDMIVWDKALMGMGSRSRNVSEFLVVCQKKPTIAKNWKNNSILDIWTEKIPNPRTKGLHPHRKPVGLITTLIQSCSNFGSLVLDPCAGSFHTLDACVRTQRIFYGSDIDPRFCEDGQA